MILAEGLSKVYRVHRRDASVAAALTSLWRRRSESVMALAGVSFCIDDAERVGILGPNGAGKTTLMKLASGLLHPSAGSISVDGHVPHERAEPFLRHVGLVMGNKGQLIWDLPPADTFEMIRVVFRVPVAQYRSTLSDLVDLLQLATIMGKPTRQLSLGERMRCELAASLVHQPRVLFLDEPTIGLDVSMQAALREFIAEYNRRRAATILLTSHYMEDVRAICPRVIIVDRGSIQYDGDLRGFVARRRPEKIVCFRRDERAAEDLSPHLSHLGKWARRDDGRLQIHVPREEVSQVVGFLVEQGLALDLTVEDPSLEEVLRQAVGGREASTLQRATGDRGALA